MCIVGRRRGYHGVRQEKEGRSLRVLPARGEPLDGRKTTPEGAFLHLGRYTTVEAALEGWPKEVEGLRRFANRRREKADGLKKERSSERTVETILKRARKAKDLAEEIAAKLRRLHDLKDQGKV